MSTEKVSSSQPGQAYDSVDNSAMAESVQKDSPSAFDKVMEKYDRETDDKDGKKSGDKKVFKLREGQLKTQEETPLKDLSAFHQMRSRTMERCGGTAEVGAVKGVSQKVIDEVVEAVRIGTNRAGDREIQLDLKSTVLDGLTIRVSVHNDKVVTVLEAATHDVKSKLESHMGELMHALEQKNLKVEQVEIRFKEEPRQQQEGRSGREQSEQEQEEQQQAFGDLLDL